LEGGTNVWARVSSYEFGGEANVDEGIRTFERSMTDDAFQMEGMRDAYLLIDRATGKALTMTLWESEEALRASEESADQLRRAAAGDAVRTVDRYEVALHESFT
jgi:heme-degrading monooxygenase HmoA